MSYNKNISSSDQQPPIITTENYEMYFLMYVDGELDQAAAAAVEAFLSAHPGLQEEMNQLKEAVLTLPEEEIVLPNKMNLFKFNDNGQNLEERIILSIDKELTTEEVNALNNVIAQNQDAQKLLQQYRLTVLEDEKIEYPNKAALYQSTGKTVSMFRTRWVELSVAAAVALFIGVNIFSPMKPSEVIIEVVNHQPPVVAVKPPAATEDNKPTVQIAVPTDEQMAAPAKNEVKAVENTGNIAAVKTSTSSEVNNNTVTEDKKTEKIISTESNISTLPNVEHTNSTSETAANTAAPEESFYASFDVTNDSEALLADKQLEDLKKMMASNELTPAHNDISEDPIPLRGLLLKVKRELFKSSNRSANKSNYSIHFR